MKRAMLYLAYSCLVGALAPSIYGTGGRTALASTSPAGHTAWARATPVATMGPSVLRTRAMTTGSVAYSPARPAPVVPAGAVVISQTATASRTRVVYRFGGLYYNVMYSPTGRYFYTVTRVPSAAAPSTVRAPAATTTTVRTLPSTGGADPVGPATPVLPLLLGGTLAALGLLVRRLSRMIR